MYENGPNKLTKLPSGQGGYPSQYNALQAGWLIATFALAVLAFLAFQYERGFYLINALAGFYIARMGLENPKPKEAKKP